MPDNQTMPRKRSRVVWDRDGQDHEGSDQNDQDGAVGDRLLQDEIVGPRAQARSADSGRMRRSGRRPVRGIGMLLGTVLTVIVLTAAGLVAYLTPLMSVRSVTVSGAGVVGREQIVAAADIATGTPLLQVDTRPAAQRIAAIPRIKTVRVVRGYPSTIDITVVERTPVAYEDRSGTVHLLDVDGVDFAQQEQVPALPRFTPGAPSSEAARDAALQVVAGLPDFLSKQVVAVTAGSSADVRLTTRDRKTIVWGDVDRGAEKARTLRYLLSRDGSEYNVTAPEFPTLR